MTNALETLVLVAVEKALSTTSVSTRGKKFKVKQVLVQDLLAVIVGLRSACLIDSVVLTSNEATQLGSLLRQVASHVVIIQLFVPLDESSHFLLVHLSLLRAKLNQVTDPIKISLVNLPLNNLPELGNAEEGYSLLREHLQDCLTTISSDLITINVNEAHHLPCLFGILLDFASVYRLPQSTCSSASLCNQPLVVYSIVLDDHYRLAQFSIPLALQDACEQSIGSLRHEITLRMQQQQIWSTFSITSQIVTLPIVVI